jgi:hypothetical protein
MTIQASGEPGLVRPLKEAVEKSIKAQIDKGSNTAPSSETHQIALKPGQDVDREETITKVSSAEFYQDVGRAVKEILEKRGAKKGINRALLPEIVKKKKEISEKDEEEKKEKKGKNDLPPFMKDKGKKEEDAEDEEEEEEEEKPKKGKKKKAEEKEEEEEPKFPIFGKKPKKAE